MINLPQASIVSIDRPRKQIQSVSYGGPTFRRASVKPTVFSKVSRFATPIWMLDTNGRRKA